MKKQFFKTALMTIAVVGVVSGSALATQITGGIGMTGVWNPVTDVGVTTTIPLSTGINFGPFSSDATTDNTFLVADTSGSFNAIPKDIYGEFPGLRTGTINDFQFVSFVPVLTPLWSAGGFSFVMSSLTYEKDLDDNNALVVRGEGTMSGNGFEVTPGSWILTSQGARGSNFAWSGSAEAAPVPEPATMLLFGSGMLGLAFVGRKIRK